MAVWGWSRLIPNVLRAGRRRGRLPNLQHHLAGCKHPRPAHRARPVAPEGGKRTFKTEMKQHALGNVPHRILREEGRLSGVAGIFDLHERPHTVTVYDRPLDRLSAPVKR